jgi:glycosyltransferase involved in cell wall biosynthesis
VIARVAFDMTFPNRNPAGSGVYATELLAELSRRDDVSIVTVAAPAGGGFRGTMRWLTTGARRAMAGAQLAHCPSFVAPWRLGVPLVLTIHDTSTEKYPDDHPLEWRAYTRLFLAERARAAVRVITGTEHSKNEIIRDLRLREDRVVVTPYGVSERFASTQATRPIANDPPLLLFPGAPTRRKNLVVVLDAMAQAPRGTALAHGRLAITGASAEGFPHHASRIASLGLEKRVEWRGKVPSDAVPDLIQGADLVVYPSLHEGFGFPALEAMASGTPVLASNASCLPEVLGDAALLIDPTDVGAFIAAAEALLHNSDLRTQMIARGKSRAARFTWRRCAELTVQVYADALATISPGTPRGREQSPRG